MCRNMHETALMRLKILQVCSCLLCFFVHIWFIEFFINWFFAEEKAGELREKGRETLGNAEQKAEEVKEGAKEKGEQIKEGAEEKKEEAVSECRFLS